jgi:hypothetical protein
MAKTPQQKPLTSKARLTQLQAKGNNGRGTFFKLSDRSETDIRFIKEFCRSALSLNPSFTVIMRRALKVYIAHLTQCVADAMATKEAGASPEEYLGALQSVLDRERAAIRRASGRDV